MTAASRRVVVGRADQAVSGGLGHAHAALAEHARAQPWRGVFLAGGAEGTERSAVSFAMVAPVAGGQAAPGAGWQQWETTAALEPPDVPGVASPKVPGGVGAKVVRVGEQHPGAGDGVHCGGGGQERRGGDSILRLDRRQHGVRP